MTVCKGYIFAVALDWKNSLAVCGGADAALHIWDINDQDGREPYCRQSLNGHQGPIRTIAVDWPRKRAVSGSSDGFLRLWDIGGGICLFEFGCHTGPVRALSINWSRNELLSGGEDGSLVFWVLEKDGPVKKWMQNAHTAV